MWRQAFITLIGGHLSARAWDNKMNPCQNASNSDNRHQKEGTEKSGHRGRKTRRTGGVLFERVWFFEGVGMERLNLDAGDKK